MRSAGLNRANLLAADGQALPTLGAPALQHQPSVLRAHPHQKPVGLCAMTVIRLKRAYTLRHYSLLKSISKPAAPRSGYLRPSTSPCHSRQNEDEPPMLANGFRACQSSWFVLQSPSFRPRAHSTTHHARLVSPQSFPHLWKTLWKIAGFCWIFTICCQSRPISMGI